MNKKQLNALVNALVLSVCATDAAHGDDADGIPLTEDQARTLVGRAIQHAAKSLVAAACSCELDAVVVVKPEAKAKAKKAS